MGGAFALTSLITAETEKQKGDTAVDTLVRGVLQTSQTLLEGDDGIDWKDCPDGGKLYYPKSCQNTLMGCSTAQATCMKSSAVWTPDPIEALPQSEDQVHPPAGSLERKQPVLHEEVLAYPELTGEDMREKQNISWWTLAPATLLLLAAVTSLF